ncbi:MAG: SGNH/GDSL hydrolase family protein, partial [Verrucomicrobiales bacterium]|nr:SGNH/GDSL hydrolase family protein [Verrucomicrobiales bacterium]
MLASMHRLLALSLALTLPALAEPPKLVIEKGTHIAILGSGFADRLQHTPWFEAHLHKRFSSQQLVVRNLGFSADEVTTWHRSQDFGSQDDWLNRTGADIIFAFWGFNESFQGPDGIDQFKSDLATWIDAKRAQSYGGSPPQLALFSPIAAEETSNPDLPDVRPINQNLALYTTAIQQVAIEKSVPFVDLFKPSLEMFAREDAQLTVNAIHLKDDGYQKLAADMFVGLLGGDTAKLGSNLLDKINAKNEIWFSRYRT